MKLTFTVTGAIVEAVRAAGYGAVVEIPVEALKAAIRDADYAILEG